MNANWLQSLIRQVRRAATPAEAAGLPDAELLRRWVAARDEAAFEVLLWRHAPLVLGVCRRLLRDEHAIEDAFQATFLTFVRKASSITRGQAVSGWLYQVAYRVALRARATQARQGHREQAGAEFVAVAAQPDATDSDWHQVLDEEVNRLPSPYRAAFVACCLEGKSGEEAARELGCAPGTVWSRLTRAREQLRRRLTHRGIAPAVAAAALVGEASAMPPAATVHVALRASLAYAAGQAAGDVLSPNAMILTEGVLRSMLVTKLKTVAVVILLFSFLAAGGALARYTPGGPAARPEAAPVDGGRPVVVRVATAKRGGVDQTMSPGATVYAFEQVEMHPAVAGVLKDVRVDLGDRVKAGQLLAEIDAPELALDDRQAAVAVRLAKGQLLEGQARLTSARSEVVAAESLVRQRQAQAESAEATQTFRQRELDRATQLMARRALDAQTLDEKREQSAAAKAQAAGAAAALETARAQLQIQKNKVTEADAAVATLQAGLEAAQIGLEKAHYRAGLTRIVAPFDGVVTQRNTQIHSYVQPAGAGGRAPVLVVQRVDRVRVVVLVPHVHVLSVEPGTPAELTVGEQKISGLKVSRVGFAENEKDGTMRAEIDVPNARHLLRPGMFVHATIYLRKSSPRAVLIPLAALVKEGANDFGAVYVVRDGKARRTSVTVSFIGADKNEAEVSSGLKPGDVVVTTIVRGAERLDGATVPVEVQREE